MMGSESLPLAAGTLAFPNTTCKPDAEASQPCLKLKSDEDQKHIFLHRSSSGFGRPQPAAVSTRTVLSGTIIKQLVAAMLRHAADGNSTPWGSAVCRPCDWSKEISASV